MKPTFNEESLRIIAHLLNSPYYLGYIVKEYVKKYPNENHLSQYIKEVKNTDEVSFADFMFIMVDKIKIKEDHDIWFSNLVNSISHREQSSYAHNNLIKLLNKIEKEENIDISEIARLNGNIKYYKHFIKSKPENIHIENVIVWLSQLDKNIYSWREQTKKDILFLVDLIPYSDLNKGSNKELYSSEIAQELLPILESIYIKEQKPLILSAIEKIINKFPIEYKGSIITVKDEDDLFTQEEEILYTYTCHIDKKRLKDYAGNNVKKMDTMYRDIVRIIQAYIKEKTNETNDSYGLVYVSTNENVIKEVKQNINEFLEYKTMLFNGAHLVDEKGSYSKYLEEISLLIKQQIELEKKVPNKNNVIKKKKI